MSEILANAGAAMPRGHEKIDRIEVVKDDSGEVAYNGVIELGEGENKYERRILLPDLAQMWGYNQTISEREWQEGGDPEKAWLRQQVLDLRKQLDELKTRFDQQQSGSSVAQPVPPESAAPPETVAPQKVVQPEPPVVKFLWEKDIRVPVEVDGEIQTSGWFIDSENPDGTLNVVHKTGPAVDDRKVINRSDADRWQWQTTPEEHRQKILSDIAAPPAVIVEEEITDPPPPDRRAAIWAVGGAAVATALSFLIASNIEWDSDSGWKHKVEKQAAKIAFYQKDITTLNAAKHGLRKQLFEYKNRNVHLKNELQAQRAKEAAEEKTEATQPSEFSGTHTDFFNYGPDHRRTGVELPKTVQLTGSPGHESLVTGDGTVLLDHVLWDEQGKIITTQRATLAKSYKVGWGKLANRFKTVLTVKPS